MSVLYDPARGAGAIQHEDDSMSAVTRLLGTGFNGVRFFTGFLPSFSRIGYEARSVLWEDRAPDFSGQRWLVTGASTGLGRVIASTAARHGAEVVAVARSGDKLEQLRKEAEPWSGSVEVATADLSLRAENRRLAQQQIATGRSIDVLVNNVGVLLNAPATTSEGLDAGFATNLLGSFILTESLREAGALQTGAAVISMSSGGMYNVPLSIGHLERMKRYSGSLAYAYHKRAQVVLNAWWRAHDSAGINYYVMHPGWADTPGVASSLPEFHALLGAILRTPMQGADTALWLASERPPQARNEDIWFDRALRPTHLLWGTREGDRPEALLNHLRQRASATTEAAGAI